MPCWRKAWGCKPLTFETKATTAPLLGIYPLREDELTNRGRSVLLPIISLVSCLSAPICRHLFWPKVALDSLQKQFGVLKTQGVYYPLYFISLLHPSFSHLFTHSVWAQLLSELLFCVGWKIRKLLENWLMSQCSQSNRHWQRQLKYFAEVRLFQEEQILTMSPECPINNFKMSNSFPLIRIC